MRDSSRTPTRTRRRMRALPSKRRLGSFSSRVRSELRILAHVPQSHNCCKYLPGGTTNLGQSQLDSPDLALVAETILADELQLGITNPTLTSDSDISGARSRSVASGYHIQTSGLERTTGDAVRLGVGTRGRHCGCRCRRKLSR